MAKRRKIKIDQRLLRPFRRRALAAYPNEYIESLWGKLTDNEIRVLAVEPVKHKATPDKVNISAAELMEDEEAAKDSGMRVVGSIHTHPDMEDSGAAPSEQDFANAVEVGELVIGICRVAQCRVRKSTRIRLYLAQEPIKP